MQAFESRWGDSLPVMKGDFTEYWTDGLGSNAQKTGESREVKERLVQGEILWSMLSDNAEEPRDLTSEAWRNMILSTEHTWAFMDPVKDEFQQPILKSKLGYFDRAKELTDSLVKMSYAAIEDKSSNRITVFNTENHAKSGIVLLPADIDRRYNRVIDSDGKETEVQRLTNGQLAFHAENVAPLGCSDYLLKRGKPDMTHTKAHTVPNVLDNGIVRVEVDPATGDIVSLLFNGEEFVNNESTANINSFRYLEGDKSSGYALKPYDIKIRKREQGPLINSIIIESKAKGCNSLFREVIVTKGSPMISFHNRIDKQAITDKEGVHFGFAFDIEDPTIHVNIPWGVMELEKDQLTGANRNWITMQRWLDMSNGEKGVTWVSRNACAFESGDLTANIIGKAYKSPKWIESLPKSATIYSWALNNHWHTNFPLSQSGIIGFKYDILPHTYSYDAAEANKFAIDRYRPLIAVRTKKDFRLDNRLIIDAPDAIVMTNYITLDNGRRKELRLHSMSDKNEKVKLSWEGEQPAKIECTAAGNKTSIDTADTEFSIPAKGVVTISIER